MASHEEMPSLSLRNGFRCVPEDGVTVEEVLISAGGEVGHENIVSASRMNKAVVVFLKEQNLVNRLIENGLVINENFVQVTPLYAPTVKITVSNVPPFIPDEALERELVRFGKFASGFKTIALGCKHPSLKHVQSFRRQVFMFLDSPENTLDVSFRVRDEGKTYMVYASTGSLRCFDCGDLGHKRFVCPHRERAPEDRQRVTVSGEGDAAVRERAAPEEHAGPAEVSDSGAVPSASEVHENAVTNVIERQQNENIANTVQNINVDEQQDDGVEIAGPSRCEAVMLVTRKRELCFSNDGSVVDDDNTSDENVSIDYECDSQGGSVCGHDGDSQDMSTKDSSLYTLEEINGFLDETFGKQVNIKEFFPDTGKFERSVAVLQKTVNLDQLSEKKRFRLKKHVTVIRKSRMGDKKKRMKAFL
ncbi:ubiquitin-conjugating enzyme E2 variant [Pimephales promelas]|nr:ubiquitin-conjugating enzyme E2 variant [Pimephales promelas]